MPHETDQNDKEHSSFIGRSVANVLSIVEL